MSTARANSEIDSTVTLVRVLCDSGVLRPEQRDHLRKLDAARHADPKAVAKELVQRNWLTPFQVNQVFLGRGDELVLGPYILLERIGEGGMGQVFKARQARLDRTVALKVIRKDRMAHPAAARRFKREVQAVAQLSHPNIVMAFDADQANGSHFLVMEYVDGTDLSRCVQQHGPMAVPLACECIRQAALGLQHVQNLGMVHRDIKPSNLIMSGDWRSPGAEKTQAVPAGESRQVPAVTVKLLDLGLTRVGVGDEAESKNTLTKEGSVCGTPDFIAPEQALNSHRVDIRADLYSLGCTFYFLLTGRAPFPGGTALEKLLKHRLEEPQPVEQLRPNIPAAVVDVVRKLMAKKPEDRFQTPTDLAVAMQRLLGGGPAVPVAAPVAPAPVASAPAAPAPAARPAAPAIPASTATAVDQPPARLRGGMTRRQRLLAERRRRRLWLAGGAAGLAASLILFAVLLAGQFRGTSTPPPPGPVVPAAAIDRALLSLQERARGPAADLGGLRQEILDFCRSHPGTPQAQQAAALFLTLDSPLGQIDAGFRPLRDRVLKLMGQLPNELINVLGRPQPAGDEPLRTVAVSPDCSWIAAGGTGSSVYVWAVGSTRRSSLELPVNEPVASVAFAPDARQVAAAGWDHLIHIWPLVANRQTEVLKLAGHTSVVWSVAFSPDGKTVASGGNDATVRIWSADTGQLLHTLTGHSEGVLAVAFSPDGKTVASAGRDGTIRLWDPALGQMKADITSAHDGAVHTLAYAPNGLLLATGGEDGTIRLWDTASNLPRTTLRSGTIFGGVTSVAFSPDSKSLVSLTWFGNLVRWDAATGDKLDDLRVRGASNAVAFAADGRHLVTANLTHTVYILRLKSS